MAYYLLNRLAITLPAVAISLTQAVGKDSFTL